LTATFSIASQQANQGGNEAVAGCVNWTATAPVTGSKLFCWVSHVGLSQRGYGSLEVQILYTFATHETKDSSGFKYVNMYYYSLTG